MDFKMTARRPLALILLYLTLTTGLIGFTLYPANPGGPDDGLLHLAGATALLRDGQYPIVQRPPFYSAVLAVLAVITGTDATTTQPLAQELGSIDHLDVASAMLDTAFLRAVLILNLLLWTLTALLVILTLRDLAISGRGIAITMILLLTPSSWAAVGLVSETPLTAFLLALGVFLLSRAFTQRTSLANLLLAGTAFALAALTRAAFQLLAPLLLILLIVVLWRRPLPNPSPKHWRGAFSLPPPADGEKYQGRRWGSNGFDNSAETGFSSRTQDANRTTCTHEPTNLMRLPCCIDGVSFSASGSPVRGPFITGQIRNAPPMASIAVNDVEIEFSGKTGSTSGGGSGNSGAILV
jgi:hypothetical protein